MYDDFIKNTNPLIKFLSCLFIILATVLFKTLPSFIVIFIINLIVILMEKNVKTYVKSLKKYSFILILFSLIYIIIVGYYNLYIFIIKMILILNILNVIIETSDFNSLHYTIYKLLFILRVFNVNVDSLSYKITLFIYFFKYYISGSDCVKDIFILNPKRFVIRVIYADQEIKKLDLSLKLNFYRLSKYRITIKDICILLFALTIFIITIYKEVII